MAEVGAMWVDVFPHGLRAVQSVRTIEISVRIMQYSKGLEL